MSAVPEPDVYGEPRIYECTCRQAHGVRHVCALCRATSDYRPTEAWVEGEHCRTCLIDEREWHEAQLAILDRKLRRAVHAVDGRTGERIPPKFLTAQGWADA